MEKKPLVDLNVESTEVLVTPAEVQAKLPLSDAAYESVARGRQAVRDILDGKDRRLMVIVGPCSIHDPKAAREYALGLRRLSGETGIRESLFPVMRVYFEKPRTTIGWKGLINDPHMDDSFQIQEGLMMARKLLLDFNEMGLPCASEALDPISPRYISELISWSAIGARTTESQTHREMASGLSMPVGFKNGTDGSIQVALDAMRSALQPHHFLGINQKGQSAVIRTRGNRYGHLVLRGGGGRPNYDSVSVAQAEEVLRKAGLRRALVVDCSHANSNKDHALQPLVMENCVNQILEGNGSIVGLMVESNLLSGSQPIPKDLSQLVYGQSVTDKCVDWPTTEKMLRSAADKLKGFGRKLSVLPEGK
jgi:3-deoxy-7-phosphoheptulonate synthase